MFTPLSVEERLRNIVGRPLALWIIAAAAATPEEIEEGKVPRERYLVPCVMTPNQYKARLV